MIRFNNHENLQGMIFGNRSTIEYNDSFETMLERQGIKKADIQINELKDDTTGKSWLTADIDFNKIKFNDSESKTDAFDFILYFTIEGLKHEIDTNRYNFPYKEKEMEYIGDIFNFYSEILNYIKEDIEYYDYILDPQSVDSKIRERIESPNSNYLKLTETNRKKDIKFFKNEYELDKIKFIKINEFIADFLRPYYEKHFKIDLPTIESNKGLQVNQIALIYAYEGQKMTRETADEIALKHGYKSKTSGEGLFQDFTKYSSIQNRKGKPDPYSPKKLRYKIKLFESIAEHLTVPAKKRLEDEIKILITFFENND